MKASDSDTEELRKLIQYQDTAFNKESMDTISKCNKEYKLAAITRAIKQYRDEPILKLITRCLILAEGKYTKAEIIDLIAQDIHESTRSVYRLINKQ